MKEKTCPCGKQFKQYNSLQKYCSYTCTKIYNARRTEHRLKKTKSPKLTRTRDNNLSKSLDTLWSDLIKKLANYSCEYCGNKKNLHSHHIYSRSNRGLKWDVNNGICLCVQHHTASSEFSAHQTPAKFSKWLQKYKGKEKLERLQKQSVKIIKVNKESIKQNLKDSLKGDY